MFWSKTWSSVRSGAVNERVVNHWFQLLGEIVTKFSISPDCIFSMDETSTFLDKPTSKTLYIGSTESSHQPIAIHDENRETATLIPIISAAGKVFRPTVIFKGARFRASADWKNPLNALYVSFHDITAANWDADIKILVSECHKRVILLVRSARNGSRSISTAKPVNWQMDGLAS